MKMNKYKKQMIINYIELAENLIREEIDEDSINEYSEEYIETLDKVINNLTDIENIINNEV